MLWTVPVGSETAAAEAGGLGLSSCFLNRAGGRDDGAVGSRAAVSRRQQLGAGAGIAAVR